MATLGKGYLLVLKGVVVACYALLVVVATVQVFARYALGVTPAWTEEACRYLAIWVVLMTAALAIELRAHIAVDLVPNMLPRAARQVLQAISWLLIFGFLFVYLREGWSLMLMAEGQLTPGLGIPMTYIYWVLPVSGVCMFVSSLRAAWHGWQTGGNTPPSAP